MLISNGESVAIVCVLTWGLFPLLEGKFQVEGP